MSKYEWERGTVTIPASEWAGFRKGLLDKWNAKQDELLTDALRAHTAVEAAAKGKRGEGRQTAMTDALYQHCGFRKDSWGWEPRNDEQMGRYEAISRLVFKREGWSGPVTLQKPKRKDLDLKAVTKDANISLPDAHVSFRNKGRTVTWDVSENNHAVERAHQHWFARALFSALGRITWTRGSGGQIVGNDEYNRDADYEGGGGNYVTREFGPVKRKLGTTRARLPSFSRF